LCDTSKETIKHIFWQCLKSKSLIREINYWLSVTLNINIYFTITELLFGIINPMNNARMLNLIFLIIKKYIYSNKCKQKTLSVLCAKLFIKEMIKEEIEGQFENPEELQLFQRLL